MTNMTGSKLSIFSHPGKITGYWITTRSLGLDFVSGQYGCLFSRCRKYVINSLIHGHFHIGLVIISRANIGGLGMITRPIWKCPCINLYLFLPLRPRLLDTFNINLVATGGNSQMSIKRINSHPFWFLLKSQYDKTKFNLFRVTQCSYFSRPYQAMY